MSISEGIVSVVVFCSFLYGIWRFVLREAVARARCSVTLPRFEGLGLHYVEADSKDEIGELHGEIEGRRVRIRARTRVKFEIGLAHQTGVRLMLRDHHTQLPSSRRAMSTFLFPEASLNRLFRSRGAEAAVARHLATSDASAPLATFAARHGRALVILDIGADKILCSPKAGTPEHHKMQSLLPNQIRELLPPLLELAAWLDETPELRASTD